MSQASGRSSLWPVLGGALALLIGSGAALASSPIELISRVDRAPDRFGDSRGASLSADGRYVAFVSDAGNLVPGVVDGNSAPDVFLRDRLTGTTTLVTHTAGSPDVAAPSSAAHPYAQVSLSADGRYLAFVSTSDGLAPGVTDANGAADAFLWDRITGATTLISRASGRRDLTANGFTYEVHISADGQYVALLSGARNLVPRQAAPADIPSLSNLFLWRRSSGALTLITRRAGSATVSAHGYATDPQISADGRFVAFDDSADGLVPGQGRPTGDGAFLYDRAAGTVTLISHAAGNPRSPADNLSRITGLSADGRWLAFVSFGTNLVPGQTGTVPNLFLYDRIAGTTRLAASHAGGGMMSADGRWLAISSLRDFNDASDLFLYDRIAGTALKVAENAAPGGLSADGRFFVSLTGGNVFLYDRTSGRTALVSHSWDSATQAADQFSSDPSVSADGGVVVFTSHATDLEEEPLDSTGFQGLYDYRRSSGEVSLLTPADPENPALTPASGSGIGDLSADGRYAVFISGGVDLVPGQINRLVEGPIGGFWGINVFLRDRAAGKTTLLSRAGAAGDARVTTAGGYRPVLSADGKVAAFLGSTDPESPAFKLAVYDVAADAETFADHLPGDPGTLDGGSVVERPAISADGRYIAYSCLGCAPVAGQQSGHPGAPHTTDVFLYDRVADASVLVSHAAGSATTTGNATASGASISADGRWVAFTSEATDLVPGGTPPYTPNVYLFDRDTGAVTLVSQEGYSNAPAISADGRWIYYLSLSGLFLYDRTTGANLRVGPRPSAGLTRVAYETGSPFSISSDGRWLVFLGGNDGNQAAEVFLWDRVTRATRLISHAAGAPSRAANRGSLRVRISADGRRIAFLSGATDLMPGGTPPQVSLYLEDRATGARTRIPIHFLSSPLPVFTWLPFEPRLSADGSRVAFTGSLPLVPGDFNGTWDVYAYDVP